MLTKDWWVKNIGGICFASFSFLLLYAASAYITNTVNNKVDEVIKHYVPVSVWAQWAQERGEWRGSVDSQLKSLKEEQISQRQESQKHYSDLDKKQEVMAAQVNGKLDNLTTLLSEMKDSLKKHMDERKSP